MNHSLAFLGAGNMAEAMMRGVLTGQLYTSRDLIAADPSPARQDVCKQLSVRCESAIEAVIGEATYIVLAVKPQVFASIAPLLATIDAGKQCVISIMAGIPLRRLEAALPTGCGVVRAMPNTPLLVGEGMTALSANPHTSADDQAKVRAIFDCAGKTIEVPESLIDAVTATSGSGPAYLFYLAQSMIEAATQLGLDADAARLLVQQTLTGSAKLLAQDPATAQELRRRVSSPGGTTEAAINHMESCAVRANILAAMTKARDRSIELAK